MSIDPIISIGKALWKGTKKSDDKRISGQTPPSGITEVNDIPYIDDGNRLHLFDVYYPEGTDRPLPVIIDIHGGGWMYGDKELNKYYCLMLAKRGYTVFNVSYRLVPEVTIPDQIRDCMSALKYISLHMDEYPADRTDVILTGDSAGGMLSAYCTGLLGSGTLREIFGVDSFELPLKGLILTSPVPFIEKSGVMSLYLKRMWGDCADEPQILSYASFDRIVPYTAFPRTCLTTSAGDFVAHDQTVKAYELLRDNGCECRLDDVQGPEGKKLPHVYGVTDAFSAAGRGVTDRALAYIGGKR